MSAWVAGAIVVGGVAGAAINSSGAKSAAQTAANAQQQGINAQLQMFNTTQANYQPQIQLGQGAAGMLSNLFGTGTNGAASKPNYSAFNNSPGYQFALGQGQNAINKQAAASGGLYSSNTLGALSNYNTGMASTQYNSYVNQLLSMAGLGNAAASGVGSAATATGQGVANSYGNIGNAQASGILGQSNAFSNALGQGGNLLNSYLTNPNAGGQYGGEFGSGVSTNVTYQPDLSSVNAGLGVPGG